ncbi:GNAT family N-acetyltransferase [Sporolactobacillus shoreicorticis]|uniref:GNAT family N-acetyltransferase n=1 Tax=Sporolactobacillus shoreicorticis TaxID=1923877 RepID=A0ABW5S3L9_9BACL|nr:GNAT family N-acetyltransferase [Sporolactobacillus shoreicorticis]MCO7124461.1 GNAT family N-acetyltransferase [Sporolactobacillus shoreicorticis]
MEKLKGGAASLLKILNTKLVRAEELNELLATNHWDVHPIEKLELGIKSSWENICARNEKQLIGYARILSDGIRHAYICNVIVYPDFRKQGIGTAIMKEALKLLKENNLYPTLVASPRKKNYYEKFGFETESSGFTAMCIRKSF